MADAIAIFVQHFQAHQATVIQPVVQRVTRTDGLTIGAPLHHHSAVPNASDRLSRDSLARLASRRGDFQRYDQGGGCIKERINSYPEHASRGPIDDWAADKFSDPHDSHRRAQEALLCAHLHVPFPPSARQAHEPNPGPNKYIQNPYAGTPTAL